MNLKVLLFICCLGYGVFYHYQHRPLVYGEGVIAPKDPIQTEGDRFDIKFNDFTLTPLASYEIEARVLSREDYSFGVTAQLSPTDLAVGWGPMSDEAVLNKIEITQSQRFFYWHVNAFPIPQQEIETHAANMHIIPASDSISLQLKKVRVGQIVRMKGQLIEARKSDGWNWRSSLSREDTGNGACELMYVTEFEAV